MARSDRSINKTERLFALVLLLQNRPNMTSRDLAEHFGVSRAGPSSATCARWARAASR